VTLALASAPQRHSAPRASVRGGLTDDALTGILSQRFQVAGCLVLWAARCVIASLAPSRVRLGLPLTGLAA
jgi:hypothetical protein